MTWLRGLGPAAILLVTSLACPAQTIGLWDAPLPREMLAADTSELAAALTDAGYEVTLLDTDQLLDPAALSPDALPLILCPTLGAYPHGGLGPLADYLHGGGSFMSLGGAPFDMRVTKADGEWQAVSLPEAAPDEIVEVADFDHGLPDTVSRMGGEGDGFGFETLPHEEGGGSFLRASVEDLQQYEYVRIDLRDTGDDDYSILRFRARADANSPVLGIEMNETDESRWKMVLPLSTEWRDYTIYIPHMLSYATEGRGEVGDYLRPSKLLRVGLGFAKGMVGDGPHTLDIDDVQRWRFNTSDPELLSRSTQVISATIDAYSAKQIKTPLGDEALAKLFTHAERFTDVDLRGNNGSTVCDGWFIDYPWTDGPAYKNVVMSRNRTARVLPLLQDDAGRLAGAITIHSGGELAGGTLAWLATDATDLLERPMLKDAMLDTLDLLLRRPRIVSLEPSFEVEDGKPAMTLTAMVRAPRTVAVNIEGALTVASGFRSAPPGKPFSAQMPPGATTYFAVTFPASRFDPLRYTARAQVQTGDGPRDIAELVVDTRGVMTALCNFFVERQTEEGTFHGFGFTDERAARGLLAMYDMTGEEKYRDAAIRWGEHEIDIQREDGGYRMGYGISERGEACYVADGGEIAIGMVRLLNYLPDDRRAAFLDSLRRYFDYREANRLDDGKIGVGWVITGMWMQNFADDAKLDQAMRSDVSRGFVVGCTLASAAAFAQVTGEQPDRDMVAHDSRWFLDDGIKATSVMAEAAQWAHYFAPDEGLRVEFAQRMKDTLVPWPPKSDSWWYTSGGRGGVTLGALHYYATQIEADPVAQAEIMRGTYYMVGDQSPSGLLRVMEDENLDSSEWRYLCYASVSLAELLEPLSTMRGIGER